MPAPDETLHHRLAGIDDEPTLLALMRAFYAEEHLVFDELVAQRAVRELLTHSKLGLIVLLESANTAIGHLTITFGFSLEFHGRYALVDELYLVPAVRGRGWSQHSLQFAAEFAKNHGMAALRLEVNHANTRARSAYLKAGFQDNTRDLFTRWL